MYPDLLNLVIFGFVTAFTPGPNNITASYSGFNFGFRKTLPLILAVIFGWTSLLILMDTGLILIFRQYPFLQDIIRVLGSIFLVYLAYLISFSKSSIDALTKNPITFTKAFVLQFINPKSIVVSMTSVSIFIDAGDNYLRDSIIVISFAIFFSFTSIMSWSLLGKFLRRFANNVKFYFAFFHRFQ